MAVALKKQQDIDLKTLAADALEQAGGNVVEATNILESWAVESWDVYRAVTERLLRQGCYSAVSGICRRNREAIWYSPGYDAQQKGDRVHAHARTLLDFPLPGGKRLADANKKDLQEAMAFYRRQADQMGRVAEWLGKIAQKVGKGIVGQRLTDEDLRRMQKQVQVEVE